jgi:hypothetical protein
VASQPREGAAPRGPDAAERHSEIGRHLLVARTRLPAEQCQQRALARGQRVERGADGSRPLGVGERVRGAPSGFADLPRDWQWLVNIAILSDVVAYLEDGRRAELLYQLLLPFSDRCVVGWPLCLGSASRPLGRLATTMGRSDAAARHFEDALLMNAKIRSPLWIAHTRHDYARTLLRRDQRGDREHALELLNAARSTAHKLGLKALTVRALQLTCHGEASTSRRA